MAGVPARQTMADIIRRVRVLIGDQSATTWVNDADIQDQLDSAHQSVQRYEPLRIEPTRTNGGFVYTDFYATEGNWEADVVITDGSYVVQTAYDAESNPGGFTLADLIVGHWTFLAQPAIPVYATGKRYDIYGAAADLTEAEISAIRKKFDVGEVGGATAKRHQMIDTLVARAKQLRRRQIPKTAGSFRSDTELGTGSGGPDWAGRGGWTNTGDPNA